MPRYFFDLNDGVHIHDSDGVELAGVPEVERHAKRVLVSGVLDRKPTAFDPPLVITVRNGVGEPVYEATMSVQWAWHAKER